MRFIWVIAAIAFIGLISCSQENTGSKVLSDRTDSVSYSIGLVQGKQILETSKRDSASISYDHMLAGFRDGISGDSLQYALPLAESKEIVKMFNKNIFDKRQQAYIQSTVDNYNESKEFLSNNKQKPDVDTTDSGLQYKVIAKGSGQKPKEGDHVLVNYRGTLIDGTVFDQSKGEPVKFQVNNKFLRGWSEGLQLMSKGARYILYIPPELGYGSRKMKNIPPNSTLIIEVQLIDIIN